MKKFTFIAEFKNGTYISQYKADNLMEAVLIWADNLDVQFESWLLALGKKKELNAWREAIQG